MIFQLYRDNFQLIVERMLSTVPKYSPYDNSKQIPKSCTQFYIFIGVPVETVCTAVNLIITTLCAGYYYYFFFFFQKPMHRFGNVKHSDSECAYNKCKIMPRLLKSRVISVSIGHSNGRIVFSVCPNILYLLYVESTGISTSFVCV
jgi:hypothetical protein